jgi:hypothetical protein
VLGRACVKGVVVVEVCDQDACVKDDHSAQSRRSCSRYPAG